MLVLFQLEDSCGSSLHQLQQPLASTSSEWFPSGLILHFLPGGRAVPWELGRHRAGGEEWGVRFSG